MKNFGFWRSSGIQEEIFSSALLQSVAAKCKTNAVLAEKPSVATKNTPGLFLASGPVHVLRLRLVMFRLKHCVVVMRLGRAKDAFSGFNTLTQFGLIVVFC